MSNDMRQAAQNLESTSIAAPFGEPKSGLRVRRARRPLASLAKLLLLLPALVVTTLDADAADLKPETVERWEEYVAAVDANHAKRAVTGVESVFLSSDLIAGQTEKLRSGEIVVAPAGPHVPLRVPSGLIHDWIGAVFIPNATLNDVIPVVRDYDRYKEFYHPNVVESKRTGGAEAGDQFSMVLMNKSVVAKTALDSDYQVVYTWLDDRRCYSITRATRIREIAEYGTESQHTLPQSHGTGLIWQLHSVTRFEERDGGVYIEVEALALSRDIPVALRWAVEPIVRRVSRSSVATSLQQTEAAVRGHLGSTLTTSSRPVCAPNKSCGPVTPMSAFSIR